MPAAQCLGIHEIWQPAVYLLGWIEGIREADGDRETTAILQPANVQQW